MKTDNELIAEFMGLKMIDSKDIKEDTNVNEYCFNPRYHTSWDWLMPVVEKIKSTIGIKSVDECSEKEWYITSGLTRLPITTPLTIVYKAVVEFIKWFNQQNKQP